MLLLLELLASLPMKGTCNLVTMLMVGTLEAFHELVERLVLKTSTASQAAIPSTPARRVPGTFTTSFPSIT